MPWHIRDRVVEFPRPLVMGIVNVTPDSFSDGGQFFDPDRAVEHGLRLAAEGADFLDVGGESSRPGAKPVSLDDELARVIPVVRGLAARTSIPISVDTMKAEVARRALASGAAIVNDITAGGDSNMAAVVRDHRAGLILMHMRGTPETMQQDPAYADVTAEIRDYLAERTRAMVAAGVPERHIAVDPGIGFGKTFDHTMQQLRELGSLSALGRPVVLGVSRKGFIGQITGRDRSGRLAGSLAVACYGAAHGTCHIVRVHDVAETVDAMKVIGAIGSTQPNSPYSPINRR